MIFLTRWVKITGDSSFSGVVGMPSLLKAEEIPAKKLMGVSPDYKEREEHRPKPGIMNIAPLRQKSCKLWSTDSSSELTN